MVQGNGVNKYILFYCVDVNHISSIPYITLFCFFNPVKLTRDWLCLFAKIKKKIRINTTLTDLSTGALS